MKAHRVQVLLFLATLLVCILAKTPDSKACDMEKENECNAPFTTCQDGWCTHKGVFPIEWQEFVGAFTLAITISLCNAAGIGGGGIIVTIGITLFTFSPKEAVAMSNFVIFFGCITRYIRNFHNKHPLKDATAIDYGIVTCQLPLVMLGTFVGVQVNELLPETLVFILLFVTLIYLTYKAGIKGYQSFIKDRKESAKKKSEDQAHQRLLQGSINRDQDYESRNDINRTNNDKTTSEKRRGEDMFESLKEQKSLGATGSVKHEFNNSSMRQSLARLHSRQSIARGQAVDESDQDIDEDDKKALIGERRSTYHVSEINETLEMYLKLERSHFRPRTFVVVLVPFFSILIIGLLRGAGALDSIVGISRCDPMDFVLLALQIVILIVLAIVNIVLLKQEYNAKQECGYQFVKGDIVWDSKSITKFAIFAIIAGFISGAVGLSGGILFTPLFLDFGIAPTVASGTSMFMAMFATLSSSILFMFGGFIIYPFAAWLSFFAIMGTAAGITVIGQAVKKSGKTSLLVILLAFVILASTIAEGIVGTLETLKSHNDGDDLWKFNSYC